MSDSFVSWKDYVDIRFAEAKEAVDKAVTAMDKRLEGMNEIRANMATKIEVEGLREQVQELRRARANLDGRLAIVAAGAGAVAALLVKYIGQ